MSETEPEAPGEATATATIDVDALIAAGRHGEAAARLCEHGALDRAQALLEKIWDFAGAARIARERGDRAAALRLLIDAKDLDGFAAILDELLRAGAPDDRRRAAEACERKRLWREAAALRERLGEIAVARELQARAGAWLDAGRLDEHMGRLREAGMAYEKLLGEAVTPHEARRGRFALGRVLGTLGRHEEAARHLQAALRPASQAAEGDEPLGATDARAAREQLAASLVALGMRDGARAVLEAIATIAKEPEEPLERFLARRERDAGGDLLAGRYRVARLLGSGGMGRVYLARDRVTDEDVAVKVVSPPVDPRARDGWRRFLREAEAVALLAYPNLVAVREVREEEGLLVMEFMAGGTLESRLPMPLPPAKALLAQIVRGLQAAHARGVIHRDIKPANVFLTLGGDAKLGDFGVAHLADLGATQTAGFIGTLAYMSPEQITGAPLTFACDVYSLGVTAFQVLTGRLPFEGPDFVSAHLGEEPPPPSRHRPALGPAVDRLVGRMLQKDPAARHATLEELLREIEALPVEDEGPARAVGAGAAAPMTDAARGPAERYRVEADLASTPISTLHRAVDERLGRPVIVERFAPSAFAGPAGAARRAWLSAVARRGGPHLQRVLAWSREAGVAVYEDVAGTPPAATLGAIGDPTARARAAARIALDALRALLALHREGVAHGGVAASLLVEPTGAAVVLVAGQLAARSDGTRATPDDDLAALARAMRDAGVAIPDGDAGALAAWARGIA